MNEVLLIALVASIAPTLTAGGALVFNVYNAMQARKLHEEERVERAINRETAEAAAKALADKTKVIEEKIDRGNIKVDGRLSELLETTKREARANGMIEGAAEEARAQGVRDVAVVAQIEQAKAEMPPDMTTEAKDAATVLAIKKSNGAPVIELTVDKPTVIVKKKP